MHFMVYSSPGEMFRALTEAFGFGAVIGGVAIGSLWHWSHKQRVKREGPRRTSKDREFAEFGRR